MDKDVKVTVLMPVFNCESFLKSAIDSVLNQSFCDYEFLIINDGSNDNSGDIILSYNDSRINYIKNETNLELISTLNKGIDIAKGKYIIRMDADDVSLPERIEKLVKFMDANPEVALCGSWFQTFGKQKQVIKYATNNDDIRVRMLHQTQFCHPSVILRKDVLKQNNYLFNLDFIHAEDYELFVRISEKHKVANIPEVLLNYRTHKTSVSFQNENVQNEHTKVIISTQFKKLKKDFNDDDHSLYLKFAYSEFCWFNKDKVDKLNKLLAQLIMENNKALYLPGYKLREYWSEKLFHLCYNVPDCMDIWKSSLFYDKQKMTFTRKVKKFLKS